MNLIVSALVAYVVVDVVLSIAVLRSPRLRQALTELLQ